MADLSFMKSSAGLLPSNDETKEWFDKMRYGAVCIAKVTIPRNYKFHRKFFAMLNVSYDNWDRPTINTPNGEIQCSKDAFRNDVTVLAGYHELTCNTKGEWKYKAKSISFAKMDDAEFAQLYSAVVDVIITRFLPDWGEIDMDKAVRNFLGDFG